MYNKQYFMDEFHLLLECRMYDEFRYSLIKPYYVRRKSMQKAVELLQSTNKNILKHLAVYIFKSFEKRNEILLS